jgi:putative glutathione S-transferase
VWALRQLQQSIRLLIVEPDPQAGRWRFRTPFLGCNTLQELYRRSGADANQRATVPVLVEAASGRVVLGESARLIELLNQWPMAAPAHDLVPKALIPEITRWRELLQGAVNDGVYRCGFARNQAAYDRAESELFAALDQAETALASTGAGPWRFYGLPGVADTCCDQAWREDYFGALFPLHPSGIVPAGPALATLVQAPPPP